MLLEITSELITYFFIILNLSGLPYEQIHTFTARLKCFNVNNDYLLAGCGSDSSAPVITSSNPSNIPTMPTNPAPVNLPATPTSPVINTATAVSGTTAYGVLGTANSRVTFIPSENQIIPVILESLANAKSNGPAPFKLSFNADSCTIDSQTLKAICIGYGSSKIAILDLTKFATTLNAADIQVPTEIDTGIGRTTNIYSGGECGLCGVAADVGKSRYVVGGVGGFRVYQYGKMTPDAIYNIPVGENFGFLAQPTSTSYILAPEYATTANRTRKLRVINVETGKTYTWDKNTDSTTDLGTDAGFIANQEIDAVAVDWKTKIIALTGERDNRFLLIDFAQAVFNDTTGTFSAPFQATAPNDSNLNRLSDVAITTSGNLLLGHSELSSEIGALQLPTASGTQGTFAKGTGVLGYVDLNASNLDRSACGTGYYFYGKGDPHGLSLYTALDTTQKGLIIDDKNACAAIVDLVGLANAPRVIGKNNIVDTSLPAVKALFKFVKLS